MTAATGLEHFEVLRKGLVLERDAERARREEEKARLSEQEKAQKGLAASDLESTDEAFGLGGRILVTYQRPDQRPFLARFHPGDLVEIRPRREPDAVPVTALVASATRNRLQLAFDRPPPPYATSGRIQMDLVPNDITFQRMRTGLDKVLALEKAEAKRRRDVLLGALSPRQLPPQPFKPVALLNPEQERAVSQALCAQDFFLVHGPPGTGKSHVLAEVAAQEVQRGKRVLATAASNAAVDHLLELCLARGLRALRVGHPARVSPALVEHTLDVVVENHPDRQLALELLDEAYALKGFARRQRTQGRSRERFQKARAGVSEARALQDEARVLEKKAVRSVLDSADVICVTLASLDGPVLSEESFDVAVIDEATQATEPLTLLAFLKANRLVLAGDPQQLPPTLLSVQAAQSALGVSLFERLLRLHEKQSAAPVRQILLEQYRMNEAIMAFPSREMYQGALRAGPGVGDRTLPDTPAILLIDTAGKGFDEEAEPGSGSYRNTGEADLLAAHIQALCDRGLSPSAISVIAPYSAQVSLLREVLARWEPALEIDTVDAFQGRENDAVLLTLTRSNNQGEMGFLKDLRRMNVALTRARKHLFIVGDSGTWGAEPFYSRLLEYTQGLGAYRSAWEWSSM